NQYCMGGACFFMPPINCLSDVDCAKGLYCEYGYCQPDYQCYSNLDCGPGERCHTGSCVK
ncbi:MAG: hypothetical protein WC889_06460, partial [Myxococcota bacterium]